MEPCLTLTASSYSVRASLIRLVGRLLRVSKRRPCKSLPWTELGTLTPAGRPYVPGSEEDLVGLGVDFVGDLGMLFLGMVVDLGMGEVSLPPEDGEVRGMGAVSFLGTDASTFIAGTDASTFTAGTDASTFMAGSSFIAGAGEAAGASTGAGALSMTNVELTSSFTSGAGAGASLAAPSAASSSSDPPKRSSSSEPSAFWSAFGVSAAAAFGSGSSVDIPISISLIESENSGRDLRSTKRNVR
mmetsp:Transcript_4110/g.9575  ORF Transcript_4110/g.9575 Transcript_4110/m.9575 type:complete len:243 (+) Transcript_4110:1075-1803(+)